MSPPSLFKCKAKKPSQNEKKFFKAYEIQGFIDTIEKSERRFNNRPIEEANDPRIALAEVKVHLHRLRSTLAIENESGPVHRKAWLLRNCLNIQLAIEQTLAALVLAQEGRWLMTHDLEKYLSQLKMIELSHALAPFSLGRGVHYPYLHNGGTSKWIKELRQVEKLARQYIGIEDDFAPVRKRETAKNVSMRVGASAAEAIRQGISAFKICLVNLDKALEDYGRGMIDYKYAPWRN